MRTTNKALFSILLSKIKNHSVITNDHKMGYQLFSKTSTQLLMTKSCQIMYKNIF